MYLRTILNTTLLLLLALTLGGCLNASTNNPDQPSTTPEPVTPTPTTPGATTSKTLPLTGFKTITAGRNHGCIIKNSDGSLSCWGQNSKGQLGTNNSADASTFQSIGLGSSYQWQNISGGYTHTCGVVLYGIIDPVDSSHTINLNRMLCWGDNSTGETGYGTTVEAYYAPMVVQDDDWSSVSAGNKHSCAIRLDKTLWCWGDNSNNQLGHNSSDTVHPAQVGIDKDWSSISASDQFTCGIRAISSTDRRIYCWGKNDKSQFGDDTTTNQTTPYQVSAAGTDWLSIATGQAHSCGIRSDDTLWCWGDNSYGQIGNGAIINQPTPLQIKADAIHTTTPATWSAVATGHQHTCAIALSDKSLWCWGNNETGQLGINSTAHQSHPVKITHDKEWLMITAGESHSCAVDKDDIVHCWGLNNHGQIPNGFNTNTNQPRSFDSSTNWQTIASGYHHSCGLKGSSAPYTLWCSGFNGYGQLGIGSTSSQSTLVQISANNGAIISRWESLSVGPNHSCAIAIDGSSHSLFCWGDNSQGQLADNDLSNVPQHWWPNSSSQVAAGGTDDWVMVAAGANNSCGIKGVNELWCWGDNSSGQIGNDVTSLPNDPPFIPTKIAGSWLTVTVGGPEGDGGHVCAIKTSGTLWCWGKNDKSQLGDGAATDVNTIKQIGIATNWISVKAGERHTCALQSDNTLWCWGDNGRGQTGSPAEADPSDASKPLAIPVTATVPKKEGGDKRWLDFDLGSNFTCAIRDDHKLWCWGDNLYKQLTSTVQQENAFAPSEAQSSPEWQQLALGQRHGCGIREDDNLNRYSYCWGEGAQYQFGNGSAWKSTPQPLSLK